MDLVNTVVSAAVLVAVFYMTQSLIGNELQTLVTRTVA